MADSMIEKNVKIHDKFSVEIKLMYKTKRTKKINDYNINTWFFVPNSLDINRYSYSNRQFYNDLKTYIRLTAPVYLLREIAEGNNSPFTMLEDAFQAFSINPIKRNKEKYEYHIKMFLSILNSSLRNEIEHINKNEVADDRQFLINSYLKNTQTILKKYRKLRRIINVPTVKSRYMKYYLLSDEYMSNLIEQYSFSLLRKLEEKFPEEFEKNKPVLIELIQSEISYKEEKGCPPIHKDDPESNGEVIYRRGILKKYIGSQLFLSTRKKKDGALIEQLLFSVAAGLAMIFATTIAFLFQQKFGNFTMPLFIALVISYMLKDRIKELTRFYLGGKLQKVFFDHKTSVGINSKQKFGWCKESFDFIKEEKIPLNVLKLRNRSQTMKVENESAFEKIILYRKFTRIYRKKLNRVYQQYNITGINDIVRFNLSRFTIKMDNPKVPAYIIKNDNYETIKAEKLYNINFIMKLEYNNEVEFTSYRIVFNKSGIKKVVRI